ncbi:unnamed protein product [Penicillium discolor]
MVVSGDPLGCKMGLMIGDIVLGGNGNSVYRIDETRNLVFCYSPVPSTSSSGTDTNVCSESWDIIAECAIKEKVESYGGFSGLPKDVTLSSGQTQFCCLACTVLEVSHQSGGIILFDEVTSGLKAAMEYDRILVMDDGKVVYFGSPAEAVRDSELLSSLMH